MDHQQQSPLGIGRQDNVPDHRTIVRITVNTCLSGGVDNTLLQSPRRSAVMHKWELGILTHSLHRIIYATKIVREDLGKWEIGERYGTSMIQAFNNWVVGWTDWNMAINEQGGPATFGYNAAIIVNATADEFYKQPPYYFQAHFSMFIPPDSKHVSLTSDNDGGLLNVAFITPETDVVVILMNSQNVSVSVVINDQDRGYISVDVEARSINTIIYR
uniref:Glucosylceramidase n=1 Tax=Timema tahoe TaxID=61484 RepID=A0A7R9III2_9NEOP|nr:unnamed protein product [Timema tahoe]